MSEKSFAVGSIAAAVIWGAFFYPPAPPQRMQPSLKPAPASAAARPARLAHAATRPAGATERRWWRRNLLELKSSGTPP